MNTNVNRGMGKILKWKFLLIAAPIPVFFLACTTGAYHLSPLDIINLIISGITGRPSGYPEEAHIIFFLVRLPRIFLALLVGAAFSISGAALQAIFRNPLVDSYILGLASGAAFGAALSIAFIPVPVQISGFFFGLLAVGIAYFAAKGEWETSKISLVLAGVMTSAFFSALLSVISILTDPLRLQGIVY
ncbi:MAG: iron chelate uptake ABC transporter family permease subunit [Candidatus Contubernalis sp.]|nr:iron chelate uptake ABC transporter family permease subunit [Candidatus Contubernalis sp.]